jgi:hypothetical protein
MPINLWLFVPIKFTVSLSKVVLGNMDLTNLQENRVPQRLVSFKYGNKGLKTLFSDELMLFLPSRPLSV